MSSRHFTDNPLYYTGAFSCGGKAWGRENNLPIKSQAFSGPASQGHDLHKFLPVFLSSLSLLSSLASVFSVQCTFLQILNPVTNFCSL